MWDARQFCKHPLTNRATSNGLASAALHALVRASRCLQLGITTDLASVRKLWSGKNTREPQSDPTEQSLGKLHRWQRTGQILFSCACA